MNDKTLQEMIITTLEKLQSDVTNMKSDIAWIKGKLEGRAETRHVVLTGISIFVAIGAVIVAILK